MPSRRNFLKSLGISLLAPSALLADGDKPRRSRWDMIFGSHETVEPEFHPEPAKWDNSTITAAWIGHATVLVNFYGTRIITDPVFSNRIGVSVAGLFTIGPTRLIAPALRFEDLPPIDLILLSHAHMDHLDIPTLSRFRGDIPIVTAKNTSDVIDNLARKRVQELDWGEKMRIGDVEIEALRVKHFGWRYPWESDRSRGDWNGRSFNAYLISKNGKHIVFGGDTANQEYFKTIGERGIEIELAMMPIGAYDPWIYNHANPEQALSMADQLKAKRVLPMHWRTFIQSDEPTMEPIERLKTASASQPERIVLERVGETWSLENSRST